MLQGAVLGVCDEGHRALYFRPRVISYIASLAGKDKALTGSELELSDVEVELKTVTRPTKAMIRPRSDTMGYLAYVQMPQNGVATHMQTCVSHRIHCRRRTCHFQNRTHKLHQWDTAPNTSHRACTC